MMLVQVLIAIAILAIVAAGIATISSQSSLSAKNMQAQGGIVSLQNVVQKVLTEKQLCDSSINVGATVSLPGASMPGVTNISLNLHDDPSASTVVAGPSTLSKFDLGIPNGGFNFVIPAGSAGVPNAAPPGKLWTGVVELEAIKLGEASGGQSLRRRTLGTLTILVNAANKIAECEGFVLAGSDACESLGGTWTGSVCNFPYTYPCSSGKILTGPSVPDDCKSCPANQVLVFDGSGGFNCLPYP